MGGFSTALKEGIDAGRPYLESLEATLSKQPIGATLSKFLKTELEPAIGKEANALRGTGMAADDALIQARKNIHDMAFGPRRQAFVPLLKAAQRQGGTAYANEVANSLNIYTHDIEAYWRDSARAKGVKIDRASIYSPQRGAERAVKKVGGPMFLPRISIPHAFQAPLNSLIVDGWGATTKAFLEFATSPRQTFGYAVHSGAMSQELAHEASAVAQGNFSKLLDPLRKVFGFERKWGITFSAVAGKHSAMEAAREYATSNAKWAELQLKVLGLDPAAILRQGGRLSPEDIEKAMYRSASEVMGFRSPLETPYGWEKNGMTRLAAMYKHYGFRQAKLIKDALVRAKEAQGYYGVAKIATTIATTFAVAGEIIKGAEGAISLKNPWSNDEEKNNFMGNEYMDAVAHAGGFGIVYSMFRGARHNALAQYVVGPFAASAFQLAEDVYNLRGKAVARDIGRKFGLPGTAFVNTALPPTKKKKDESYY